MVQISLLPDLASSATRYIIGGWSRVNEELLKTPRHSNHLRRRRILASQTASMSGVFHVEASCLPILEQCVWKCSPRYGMELEVWDTFSSLRCAPVEIPLAWWKILFTSGLKVPGVAFFSWASWNRFANYTVLEYFTNWWRLLPPSPCRSDVTLSQCPVSPSTRVLQLCVRQCIGRRCGAPRMITISGMQSWTRGRKWRNDCRKQALCSSPQKSNC